jgi:hypothetical protein
LKNVVNGNATFATLALAKNCLPSRHPSPKCRVALWRSQTTLTEENNEIVLENTAACEFMLRTKLKPREQRSLQEAACGERQHR